MWIRKKSRQLSHPLQVVIDENKTEETDKKEEIAKPEKEKMPQANMGAMAAILILALGGVAAYYYFKIYKPKKEEEEDFEEKDWKQVTDWRSSMRMNLKTGKKKMNKKQKK